MTFRTHDKHLALALTVLALAVVFSGISAEDGSEAASMGTPTNPLTSLNTTWENIDTNGYTEIYVKQYASVNITVANNYACENITDEYGELIYASDGGGTAFGLTLSNSGRLSGTAYLTGAIEAQYAYTGGEILIPGNVVIYIIDDNPSGYYPQIVSIGNWYCWRYQTTNYNGSVIYHDFDDSVYYTNDVISVESNNILHIRWYSNDNSYTTNYHTGLATALYGVPIWYYQIGSDSIHFYPAFKMLSVSVYNHDGSTIYVQGMQDYTWQGVWSSESINGGSNKIINLPSYAKVNFTADEGNPWNFNYWNIRSGQGTSSELTYQYTLSNSNITVDAYWTPYTYTINLNANGGTVSPTSTTRAYGSPYGTLPVPTRQNYGFQGWYTAATGGTQITNNTEVPYSSEESITLYAHWVSNEYTVVFDAQTNGGYPYTQTKAVVKGSAYGELPTASKPYNVFQGWYTAATGGTQITENTIVPDTPSGTITLYAQFTEETFTITVKSRTGGSVTIVEDNNPTNTVTVQAGQTASIVVRSAYTATATASNNYHFDHWLKDNAATLYTNPYSQSVSLSDSTLEAYFGIGNEYTITFDAQTNGGELIGSSSKTVIDGQQYGSLPTAVKQGMSFTGWYTAATGGTQITSTTTVNLSNNQTLYAQFNYSALTVTIHTDHGTITATDGVTTVTVNRQNSPVSFTTDNSTITLSATITSDEFHFQSWSYFWNDSTTPIFDRDNPFTLTLQGDVDIFAEYTQTPEEKTWYAYVNNREYGSVSNGINTSYTLSGTAQVGTQIIIENDTVTIGNTRITAIPAFNCSFNNWSGITNGQTIQSSDVTITFSANFEGPDSATVWWDNGYVNGSANVAFDLTGPANSTIYKHSMQIPLLIYDGIEGDEDGIKYFSSTSMYLMIQVSFGKIDCSLYGPTGLIDSATFNSGTWRQFTIGIDAQSGKIDFMGTMGSGWNVGQTFTFENYQTVFTRTIFDFSQHASDLAFNQIYHKDVGTGTVHPKFQVSATTTFLDTYGFVMVDPHLNIYGAFPEYNDLRLNLYSFAIYGDTITINDWTFGMEGSKIADLYYILYKDESGKVHQTVVSPDVAGAAKYEATLTNVYVTWTNINSDDIDQRQCYLTFVNDNVTFELGTYAKENLTISMEGVWYFTTALYEPYTAHETVYNMDWNNWFNLSGSAFIIAIIALLVVLTVLFNIFYVPSMLDYAIIIGAGVVSFILIGGF